MAARGPVNHGRQVRFQLGNPSGIRPGGRRGSLPARAESFPGEKNGGKGEKRREKEGEKERGRVGELLRDRGWPVGGLAARPRERARTRREGTSQSAAAPGARAATPRPASPRPRPAARPPPAAAMEGHRRSELRHEEERSLRPELLEPGAEPVPVCDFTLLL